MKTIYSIILVIHVISGFTALVSGLVPMIARKGGNTHNFWGRIYYWAMFGVFVTTVGLFALDPLSLKMQFFLPVAVASFYQTFTGKRILLRKKVGTSPARIDWIAMFAVGGFSVVTFAWAVQRLLAHDYFMAVLFGVLTVLSIISSWVDFKVFTGRTELDKMHWFFTHLGRMIASYAATLTAFLVNVVPKFLPDTTPGYVNLVTWILPGVLAGVFISRLTKMYRKRMVLR